METDEARNHAFVVPALGHGVHTAFWNPPMDLLAQKLSLFAPRLESNRM